MRIVLIHLLAFVLLTACGESEPSNPMTVEMASFSMDALTVIEGNQNKSIFINLRLSKVSTEVVNVTLETVDGSAKEGEDYTGFTEQEIIFDIGDVQEECQIQIIGDEQAEGDEEFMVRVKSISGAKIGTNDISIVIENDDTDFTVDIPTTGYTTPTEYQNMDLIWSDEFEGESLNQDFWTWETGNGSWGWGNNELQFYRKENTKLIDGNLVIQALKENYNGFNYTSSRIKTQNKFKFTHGRVDIRAALPEGQGLWPALWMLGENINQVSWPRCGEIDIMEIVGHEPSTLHGTVHYANSGGAHIQNGKAYYLGGGKRFSDEFNVFSIVWKEDKIEWYMNDIKYHTVTRLSLGTSNPYPFNEDFFFIFNVACGGQWPGSPDASTPFPQNMIVDYIRVFQDN